MNKLLTMFIIIKVCSAMYLKSFTNEIQVGKLAYDLGQAIITTTQGNTSATNQYSYDTTITFKKSKLNDSYQMAISHSNLKVEIFNDLYSFIIQMSGKSSAAFNITLNCQCNGWPLLTIRYLTVNSDFSVYVEIVHFRKNYIGLNGSYSNGLKLT